jgi:ArsR family transcriptional regulator, nickel/cobalt-responsive transcriptional repressor
MKGCDSQSAEEVAHAHKSCADFMKLLADKTRLAVIQQLLAGPRRVYEINAGLDIDPTLLSHHLRVLREAGLVRADREGKSLLYRLAPQVRLIQRPRVIDFGCCQLSLTPTINPSTKRKRQ